MDFGQDGVIFGDLVRTLELSGNVFRYIVGAFESSGGAFGELVGIFESSVVTLEDSLLRLSRGVLVLVSLVGVFGCLNPLRKMYLEYYFTCCYSI